MWNSLLWLNNHKNSAVTTSWFTCYVPRFITGRLGSVIIYRAMQGLQMRSFKIRRPVPTLNFNCSTTNKYVGAIQHMHYVFHSSALQKLWLVRKKDCLCLPASGIEYTQMYTICSQASGMEPSQQWIFCVLNVSEVPDNLNAFVELPQTPKGQYTRTPKISDIETFHQLIFLTPCLNLKSEIALIEANTFAMLIISHPRASSLVCQSAGSCSGSKK